MRTDSATGRRYVEALGSTEVAGRRTELAFGFVNGGLFYLELGSHKTVFGRRREGADHFSHMISSLTTDYGAPVSIDATPVTTARNRLGHVERRRARFEHGGVRADVTANSTYGPDREIQEVVNVRFWRVADVEAFERQERSRRGQEQR